MTRDTFDRFSTPYRGRFGDNDTAPIGSNDSACFNLTNIDVVIHHGTEKALLVSIDGMESRAQWLPRSAIDIEHKPGFVTATKRNGQIIQCAHAMIVIPVNLAKEKGLI